MREDSFKELLRDLLEYIDWLEIHGGYSLQHGGSGEPVLRAERMLNDANT